MVAEEITNTSLESMLSLLKDCKLPYEDVRLTNNLFVGYYDERRTLIGTGGLEFYDNDALLRSIAVAPAQRGNALGKTIVNDLLAIARSKSIRKVFLLTETAHDFFLKFGFKDTDRASVPLEVQKSSEFSSVCPVSAACMIVEP